MPLVTAFTWTRRPVSQIEHAVRDAVVSTPELKINADEIDLQGRTPGALATRVANAFPSRRCLPGCRRTREEGDRRPDVWPPGAGLL